MDNCKDEIFKYTTHETQELEDERPPKVGDLRPVIETQSDYISSHNAPRPHEQTTLSTTNTRNGPVAPNDHNFQATTALSSCWPCCTTQQSLDFIVTGRLNTKKVTTGVDLVH